MENKIYINELNKEELQKVFNNNEKFKEMIFNEMYEKEMDYQSFLGDEFFGNESYKYIDIRDNYSSFYLRIKDTIKFFENLNINSSDYLNPEDSKKYIELYKKAKKYYNYFNQCNYNSDNYFKNEELLKNTCKEILDILEKELHKLEQIDEEDVFDYFISNIEIYEDFYITEKENFILYQDITKSYN